MSQVDYTIANDTHTSVRADINATFAAIVTNNSGATEPTTTYAYQWWADTTTGILKMRNAANSAWISMFTIATGAWLGNAATATLATTATTATTATNLSGGTVAATYITASVGVIGSNLLGGYGVIAEGDATSPINSAFRIIPQDAQPSGPNSIGDIYVTTAGVLKICTIAGTPGTWVSVGAQT
jgi:hypothetical protein